MSGIGLNYFHNGNPLEPTETEEGEEICIKYKFDYNKGLMFIYEFHKFNDGSEHRLYKGKVAINRMSNKQTENIWNSGNASEFSNCF